MSELQRIAVIGAGQMGAGIAQVCAQAGFQVTLCDVDRARASAGRERIAARLNDAVQKGRLPANLASETLARLATGEIPAALQQVELAIEAVSEDPKLKSELFQRLDAALPAGALLASNTSSISISRLAACTQRPGQVIGMHFMNPVPLMKLVEVVMGEHTSDATLATIRALAEKLGKTVIVSKDSPGFIVNRLLLPLLNEACLALEQGLASADDIDAGARLGLKHPLGPLELADFIGLDTVLAIAQVLQQGLGNDKYAPPALLQSLVAQGRLGRKSGHGFYRYDASGQKISMQKQSD